MKLPCLLFFFVCAAGLLTCGAAAQTQIIAPSAALTETALLPLNVSGLSACPGIEFDLWYDSHVVTISGITSAPGYRGTLSIVPNINNAAGSTRVLVISTSGITAGTPTSLLMISVNVSGTGYTPLQLQNAKWVNANFNSLPFDTVTHGLVTTNGATVPPAVTPTPLPSPPPAMMTPVYPQGNPTELPTLDLPAPSATVITEPETTAPSITVTTAGPVPERTLVLFSPAPTESGVVAVATPAETTTAPPTPVAQPTTTQKSPGLLPAIALAASVIAALAYYRKRRL